MILNIKGNVNRYYVETLCLIFFPGSTFKENEAESDGVPIVDVEVFSEDDAVCASVAIRLNDRISRATESIPLSQATSIASRESVCVGRAMFSACKELVGHTPPWGILTGVRPAKIARGLLVDGKGVLKAKKILRDEYFLNPQKAALAVSVASWEAKLMRKVPENTCSLYISIPFCPTRCSYCSFVSYTTPRLLSLIPDYLKALLLDIDYKFKMISDLGLTVNTIYIGGGTPTTLSAGQLEMIFKKLSEHISLDDVQEFTLEAGRPDTITKEKLEVAKKYGVTRISVNPQTLNDEILREIGRRHTTEDFFRAYALASESGIRDINVDLIAGLPGDDFKSFSDTIDRIIDLGPTNLTVHTFCVKKAADMLKQNSGIYSVCGDDADKCISYSQLKTKFAGYRPYYMYKQKNAVGNLENVGFSLEGHEGLYNIFMMEELQTIFACGAGAVTKLVKYNESTGYNDIKRIFNAKYPYEYLNTVEDGELFDKKREKDYKEVFDFFNS